MVALQFIVAVLLLGVAVIQGEGQRTVIPQIMAECIKNGGIDAFNNLETDAQNMEICYYAFVNTTFIEKMGGMEKILSEGHANEVLKQYCDRKPHFFKCIAKLTESFKPCYEEGARARGNLDVFRNVIDNVLGYVCSQDGAQLAVSIKDEDMKCMTEQHRGTPNITKCAYDLQSIVPNRNNSTVLNSYFNIEFDNSTCPRLQQFQECAVRELQACSQLVGAHAEALLQRARESTPCNHGAGLAASLLAVLLAAAHLLHPSRES